MQTQTQTQTQTHSGDDRTDVEDIAAAIREGRPAEIGLEEGLRSVATGMAAHRSIDLGRVVEMHEVLPAELR